MACNVGLLSDTEFKRVGEDPSQWSLLLDNYYKLASKVQTGKSDYTDKAITSFIGSIPYKQFINVMSNNLASSVKALYNNDQGLLIILRPPPLVNLKILEACLNSNKIDDIRSKFRNCPKGLDALYGYAVIALIDTGIVDVMALVAIAVILSLLGDFAAWVSKNPDIPGWVKNILLGAINLVKGKLNDTKNNIENSWKSVATALTAGNKILQEALLNGLNALYGGIDNLGRGTATEIENTVTRVYNDLKEQEDAQREWSKEMIKEQLTRQNKLIGLIDQTEKGAVDRSQAQQEDTKKLLLNLADYDVYVMNPITKNIASVKWYDMTKRLLVAPLAALNGGLTAVWDNIAGMFKDLGAHPKSSGDIMEAAFGTALMLAERHFLESMKAMSMVDIDSYKENLKRIAKAHADLASEITGKEYKLPVEPLVDKFQGSNIGGGMSNEGRGGM